jgi:hypothetical protein
MSEKRLHLHRLFWQAGAGGYQVNILSMQESNYSLIIPSYDDSRKINNPAPFEPVAGKLDLV